MAEKIKSISTYNINNGQGSWTSPVPLGANIENIDITENSNVDNGKNETLDTVASIQSSDLVVGTPDTGAGAWSKFNKLKKRLGNVLARIENKINGLNNATYNFNGEWNLGFFGIATGNVYVEFPCPPLATSSQNNLTDVKLFIPGHQAPGRTDNYHTIPLEQVSVSQPSHGKVFIAIPVQRIYGQSSTQLQAISSATGHLVVLLQGSITFS